MNKTRMALGAMALAVLAAFGAWATPVDEATARTAAERFLQTSKMAARTLPARTVATIAARGNLWVVRLAPSGHILLSGSDRATPIIGFSQNDFSEGEEDSAERAMLDAADAAVAAAEADETKGRHARWDSLLAEPAASTRKSARKMLLTSGTDINIAPFVDSKYNQNQPWNDLTPVTSKDSDYIWRGRSCAGCVSIADAAIYRELEWPKYPARIETVTHNLRGENFAIRFNGSAPFDWNNMYDTYGYSGDMRGKTGAEEDKRYEIGRYVLWLNQSASMSYNQGESTSTKSTSAHGVERDWYTIGQSMSASDEAVEEKVTGILEAGIPVFVGIGGHAVVADGWQKDDTDSQVHLVYGYGGNASDKWYSLDSGTAKYFWVDHYPRAKPQLDPIPRVVGNSTTLSWHFPNCYTNSLNGFSIKKKTRTSVTITDWTADFSNAATGSAYPANVWSTYTFDNEDGKVALDAGELTYGMYQFTTPLTITEDTELSFKIRGGRYESPEPEYIEDNIVIEICGEDGNWRELFVPDCGGRRNWPGIWKENSKSLAEYAGQTVQLRIYKRHILYNGRTNIGDFKVTNVIPLEGDDDEQEVAATARSATLTGLTAGADYAFSVVPKFDDDQVVVAGYSVIPEASDEKIATIAGTHTIPGSGVDATEDYTTEENNTAELSIVFDDSFQITEDSQLSCDWYADCSAGAVLQLKVTFTPQGGEENTVYFNNTKYKMKVGISDQTGNYTSPESDEDACSLAQYAGQNGTLRASIFLTYGEYGAPYDNPGNSTINSITVTNVKTSGEPEAETLTALGMPEFTTIQYAANGGERTNLVDGYLADGSIGSSTLYVTTPVNVTKLTAVPSHVELVKDNNVHVEKVSEGNWEITFDPVIPANRDRQRMILTLHAADENGTTVHRDVVMRMTEDKIVVGEGETWTLNDDYELTRSLVLAGGTVTANGTLAINQNGISSFTVVSNSTINGTGSLCISNSNATITFENNAKLTNGLDIASANQETLTLTGTGTFVQEAGTTIEVYNMELGEHMLLYLNLSSEQSTADAIIQFGCATPAISGWKLKIDAPANLAPGTYPLISASSYLAKPTVYPITLDHDYSIEVINNKTLCLVVSEQQAEKYTTTTDYPVSHSWILEYQPLLDGYPDAMFDNYAKGTPASNGLKWWQCYVLGLDPTDANSTFTATLTMNGNTPVITYSPTNETLVADATMPIMYVLQGNASAEGGEWVDTSFDNPGSSYVRFRVDVRWTNGEVKHIYSNEVDKPAATPVAQIGDTTYTSLAAAVEDATEGATVTLVANTETTDAVTLNDKTITFVENGFAFNGTLTGNGTISVGTEPSATTWSASKFVANGWTGTFAINWDTVTTYQTKNGVTRPTTNINFNNYGIEGSKVRLDKDFEGYFDQNASTDRNTTILPALILNATLKHGNGTTNKNAEWTPVIKFTNLSATKDGVLDLNFQPGDGTAYANYEVEILDNFAGEIKLTGARDRLIIDAVKTTGVPSANNAIVAVSVTGTNCGVFNGNRLVAETNAVDVTAMIEMGPQTIPYSGKAVFATINNVSGLYYAVAKIGDSYYATYAAAVADYTDGDTIEVLDATAGDIPTGWEITSEGTRLTKIRVTITWSVDGVETPVSVDYGDTPTYDGTPTKAEDAQYTYTFTGWNPAIVVATEAATYTAVFSSTVKEYTITWKNDDDSTIDTTEVAHGVTPTHAAPFKASTAEYTYTFTGWTPAIEAVASNTTYTATYSATPIEVIPSLPDNPTSTDVTAAITKAKFTDTGVATIITGAENQVQEYNYFKTWADQIGAADVVASAHAADSYLLGTNALLQNDPVVTINAFNTGATAGAMTLSVTVTDGGTPVEVTPQKVAALIKATKDLGDWDGEGKLTPTLDVSGGVITVTLQSPEPVMFLKLEK